MCNECVCFKIKEAPLKTNYSNLPENIYQAKPNNVIRSLELVYVMKSPELKIYRNSAPLYSKKSVNR